MREQKLVLCIPDSHVCLWLAGEKGVIPVLENLGSFLTILFCVERILGREERREHKTHPGEV